MKVARAWPDLAGRMTWEMKRAFYSFRRGPGLAVLLMQAPVLAFVWFKGAGPVYLDMAGIMAFLILTSWLLTSMVHGNRMLLIYTLLLLTVGTMLQSVFLQEAISQDPGKARTGSPAAGLQLQYLLAFGAAVLASMVYVRWKEISSMRVCRFLFFISVGLSVLTLLLATSVGGVRNWITVGGLSIQTTEINKLLYVFLAAGLLGTVEKPSGARIGEFCFVSIVFALLLMVQGEYGTLLLLICVFFSYLFLFVGDIRAFLGTGLVFASLMGAAAGLGARLQQDSLAGRRMADFPFAGMYLKAYHRIANRFIYWMHPEKDPMGLGYQLLKAKESIVLGGWFGTSSVTALPVKTSDLVYPALIQRCGMIFALLVFIIFILMWLEGMKAMVRKEDRYHQAVAAGIVIMLFLQALIIIAGSTGLCPLTGITLPFISSGGSSLLVCFVMTGLLITISGNVGWKGSRHGEEELFKESTIITKCHSALSHIHHFISGPNLRNPAGSLGGSRPAEGQGETEDV